MKRLAGKPFALIGVNSDKDKDELHEKNEAENITWRSFWNGEKGTSGPISAAWNVTSWPTIYVMDAKGVIRFKGPRNEAMDDAVNALLDEMGVKLAPDELHAPEILSNSELKKREAAKEAAKKAEAAKAETSKDDEGKDK